MMTVVCGLFVSLVAIYLNGKMVRLFVWISIITLLIDGLIFFWHLGGYFGTDRPLKPIELILTIVSMVLTFSLNAIV